MGNLPPDLAARPWLLRPSILVPPNRAPLTHQFSCAHCSGPHVAPTDLDAPVPPALGAFSPPAPPPSPTGPAPSLHHQISGSLVPADSPVLQPLELLPPLCIHTLFSILNTPKHTSLWASHTPFLGPLPPVKGPGIHFNSKASLPPLSPPHCSKGAPSMLHSGPWTLLLARQF